MTDCSAKPPGNKKIGKPIISGFSDIDTKQPSDLEGCFVLKIVS